MKIDELIFGFNISLFTASCILIVLWLAIKTYCERMPKKSFIKETPTNILITGGAQGIGKLLAEKFASSSEIGSVNLIVCDIREDLGKEMIADVKKASGDVTFKGIHFYKTNLANHDDIEHLWKTITAEHGEIHILINNAARCIGKRVDELSIQQVKLTMDINFHSYIHLSMLFMHQEGLKNRKDTKKTRFHLVNVSSIAGHMTCQRNSDYSASKFALNGFIEALRQEVENNDSTRFNGPSYKITTFYPYFINTGLFEGYKPKMSYILPTLDAHYVVNRMYNAILAEEKEVYIRGVIFWLKCITAMLPLFLRDWLSHVLVGEGMEHFVGRVDAMNMEANKKTK